MIRTLIVDDEPLARRGLELRLAAFSDISIVGQAGNGREAALAVASHQPDLMFLDVQMPEVDGFALLKSLPAEQLPLTVFVTAYDQYALNAFSTCAVDYLLKPVDESRLEQALKTVRERLAAREAEQNRDRLLRLLARVSGKPEMSLDEALAQESTLGAGPAAKLAIKDGNRTIRLDPDCIRWIDAAGDYLCIHTNTENFVIRATMRDMEQRLDPRRFQRIHRSTIVNLDCVRELRSHLNGEYFVTLDSGHTLKLSRSYKDKVHLMN
ncbi:LytR/AlgR family response regulator transcription factor [Tahibacter amnicola]|uniref:LytTR family DNA-binding domain-containing protein n=1 Tax=Tahibacter amnicola TaxID=2976241 RepID=A0ABY6BKD0_9GAMM|nr:LytTR family DNA-binding domain-containing protein [Tahibacter amnicola]UXI68247.1 LytTR family DNA-binding domain-containing protein [Tahibacter amnicola]